MNDAEEKRRRDNGSFIFTCLIIGTILVAVGVGSEHGTSAATIVIGGSMFIVGIVVMVCCAFGESPSKDEERK